MSGRNWCCEQPGSTTSNFGHFGVHITASAVFAGQDVLVVEGKTLADSSVIVGWAAVVVDSEAGSSTSLVSLVEDQNRLPDLKVSGVGIRTSNT